MKHSSLIIILLLASILISAPSAQAGDWPMFGHDAAHSGTAEESVAAPLDEKYIWEYKTGGSCGFIYSSPTVSESIIYVGSTDSLYALDAETGSLKWKYKTGDQIWSSPAVSNGIVYVGSRDSNVYALDAKTGDLKWKYKTGDSIGSSPVVFNGIVYVGSMDSNVYALDAETGSLKWKSEGGSLGSSPAVYGGFVYIGSGEHLVALDVETGNLKWKYMIDAGYSSPTVSNGVVYFGSTDRYVYALDTKTGDLKWKYKTDGSVGYTSPIVSSGIVYVGSMDANMYALDAETGSLKWKKRVNRPNMFSFPTVSGDILYVGSSWGLVVLNKNTGDEIQKISIFIATLYGVSSPAVARGMTYIVDCNGRTVYALAPSKQVAQSKSNVVSSDIISKIQNILESDDLTTTETITDVIKQDETQTKNFDVTPSDETLESAVDWSGSDIDTILLDPKGTEIKPGGNVYYSGKNSKPEIWKIDNPAPGRWTLKIIGVDIPKDGEPYVVIVGVGNKPHGIENKNAGKINEPSKATPAISQNALLGWGVMIAAIFSAFLIIKRSNYK